MKQYDSLYRSQAEPWNYSERAIELLRYEALQGKVKNYLHPRKSLLEIGCSRGLLSSQIAPLAEEFTAMEISATALAETQNRLHAMALTTKLHFQIGSALELPFPTESYQCVLAADGIHEWGFTKEQKQKVYAEIHRVLRPGGHAIFSDYLKPEWFSDVLSEFQNSPFQLVETEYFGDRFCYQMESLLKAFANSHWAKEIKASVKLASLLRALGKQLGPTGSRHLFWVGKKSET
jgi:SAM-dependent methyltransferase